MNGVRIVYNNIPKVGPQAEALLGKLTQAHAEMLVAQIQKNMLMPKSGRVYGTHQASAPGEPPAVDTGALYRSLKAERMTRLEWRVKTTSPYAGYLEYGTVKMAPRPFFRTAADAMRKTFHNAAAQILGKLA